MEYNGLSLEAAMNEIVHNKLPKLDGVGGMIGIDHQGNMAAVFNSAGMYRAMKSSNGVQKFGIYKEDI
jgi:beta-aspartyl-peptidase (threonine type)